MMQAKIVLVIVGVILLGTIALAVQELGLQPVAEVPSFVVAKPSAEIQEYHRRTREARRKIALLEIDVSVPIPLVNYQYNRWRRSSDSNVYLGMTSTELRSKWFRPDDINRTVGSWGVHEQWVYSNVYFYFEDGILTSWQD